MNNFHRINRRTLIKTGAAAIAMPALLNANSAGAQAKVIKIGHVSPKTGPLAGFGEADLSIDVKENTLSIRGEKRTEQEDTTFLHRGIASRSFERRFQLADHVLVKGAVLENGLLHVDSVRELPEAMKPRTIPIATKTDKVEKPKVIDSQAA